MKNNLNQREKVGIMVYLLGKVRAKFGQTALKNYSADFTEDFALIKQDKSDNETSKRRHNDKYK